jgi:streptomycin 6-kinase
MERLDTIVAELSSLWRLEIGAVLSGGSESLVARVHQADGTPAILKIGLPGSANLAVEARVYELAGGKGYATLLAQATDHNAILLEALGSSLAREVKDTAMQMQIVCNTLKEAWVPLSEAHGFMTGAEKAAWLAGFIRSAWESLQRPCGRATIDSALEFTEARIDAHTDENAVLVHGDAHAHNLLKVGDSGNEFKFVDPDGLFAERACDLAVPMRDDSNELLVGSPADTIALACQRCEWLGELTGVDEQAIWQWGFIERVSTGLTLVQIGMEAEGAQMLGVADRIAALRPWMPSKA